LGLSGRSHEVVTPSVSGLDFAIQAARIADENHAEDVVILDLRGICSIADYFVIASGTSDRQMRGVIDLVEQYGQTVGQRPFGVNGYESSTWMLADYVDVVIHMFDADRRRFYDLELLWGDAPRVDWQREKTALVR
jgi:ribosome-associated protein